MVRCWPWLARMRSTVAQGRRVGLAFRLRRRLGQRADRGAGPGPGCRPVAGSPGQSRCSPAPQGVLGGSPAWCPAMGLDQEVVTTLGGRWARVVPWRSAPEGHSVRWGSSLRPRRGRGA
jgi:hypothetical protein